MRWLTLLTTLPPTPTRHRVGVWRKLQRMGAARKGIPFDVLGADFGHHGEDCTFETLVRRFRIKDRRVKVIAEIVHEADLHDGKFIRNEARGVDLAINGLVEATQDDHDLLERGMTIFEGLYTVFEADDITLTSKRRRQRR